MDSQGSCRAFISIVFIMTNILGFVSSQNYFCYVENNYTRNSAYESNLNTLLSSLSPNVDSFGFYNASSGQSPDQVNAMILCRADVQLDMCRSCVTNVASQLVQLCPNQKRAVFWHELCMLRYSNTPIFAILDTNVKILAKNTLNFSDPEKYSADLRQLLDGLRKSAVSRGSLLKVAGDSRTAPDFQVIYGLMQCTPDLSAEDCDSCLVEAGKNINGFPAGSSGVRILLPSCNIRYELSSFYDGTTLQERVRAAAEATPPPSSPPSPPAGKNKNKARTAIAIVVPIVASLILAVGICVFLRQRRKHKGRQKLDGVDDMSIAESIQFDFNEIRAATDDFSDANKLGQGGFGGVYKGVLQNDQEIAVKRLSRDFGQGDHEFKNEVVLLARLQHRNLVRLLGFSIEGTERLLIYEFVENASLDHFLFNSAKRSYLDWDRRYKIIVGIARGLLYLHEDSRLRIIHRDLKAGNILLDGEMIPKIADFGMARLFDKDEAQGNTRRIVGTYGYMAPEYVMHGQFSIKSDVFSFGVLVLEILTGLRNNSFRNGENLEHLLSSAWRHWREGTAINMVDPMLKDGSTSSRDILRCFHISLHCVQENAEDRPTMANVALMLGSFSPTLPLPWKPGFFVSLSIGTDVNSLEFSESSGKLPKHKSTSKNGSSTGGVYPRMAPGGRGRKGKEIAQESGAQNVEGLGDIVKGKRGRHAGPVIRDVEKEVEQVSQKVGGMHLIMSQFQDSRPPKFFGNEGGDKAAGWLKSVTRLFNLFKYSSDVRLKLTIYQLKDRAQLWWETTEKALKGSGEKITWEAFCTHFTEEYTPPSYYKAKEDEFYRLVQGNKSVAEYASQFSALLPYVSHVVSSDQSKLSRFVHGLKNIIHSFVTSGSHNTYIQAVAMAKKIETSLLREEPQPTPASITHGSGSSTSMPVGLPPYQPQQFSQVS